MIKIPIKASQISNLTDARYFAARGVEWLGFNLVPGTEGYTAPQQVQAIRGWVEGPKMVGEFGLQTAEEIIGLSEMLELDAIQIGMFGPLEEVHHRYTKDIISERIPTEAEGPAEFLYECWQQSNFCSSYFFNFEKRGLSWQDFVKGDQWTVDWLREACQQYEVLLSFAHLQASELDEIIRQVQPKGFNLDRKSVV